jgi:hypothetical protein
MKALIGYLTKEIWPRRGRIFLRWQVVLAVATVVVVAFFGNDLALRDLATDKLVTAVFAYAALALGACLTGLTVTLTLPDRAFAQFLAEEDHPELPEGNAYGDLVFVFSWTAVAHWAVIALALVTIITVGDADVPTFRPDCSFSAVLVAVLLGLLVYAMAQFLVTILTLSQVAGVYIRWIQRKGKK